MLTLPAGLAAFLELSHTWINFRKYILNALFKGGGACRTKMNLYSQDSDPWYLFPIEEAQVLILHTTCKNVVSAGMAEEEHFQPPDWKFCKDRNWFLVHTYRASTSNNAWHTVEESLISIVCLLYWMNESRFLAPERRKGGKIIGYQQAQHSFIWRRCWGSIPPTRLAVWLAHYVGTAIGCSSPQG